MKRAIVLLMLITVFAPVMTEAGPTHRARINQDWKKVEAWEKKQNDELQRIERDVARDFKSINQPQAPRCEVNQSR